MLEEETHKLYSKSISIFDLNIVKCNEVYYNLGNKEEIPKVIRWGALICNRNFEKIPEIAYGIMSDKVIERIMDKMEKLTSDSLFMSDLETIEMHEKEERAKINYAKRKAEAEGHAQGHAKGRAEGRAEGHAEKEKELILSMIKNDIDMNMISKITDKSIDEIEIIIPL